MVVVSDTTAISNLLKLGKLHYLKEVFQNVIIPQEVYNELKPLKEFGFNLDEMENSTWIRISTVEKDDLYLDLLERLDLGETEAIALSKKLHADFLIMDEKKGRIEASKLGIKTIGILGILIQCRRLGICPNLKLEIDDLKNVAGFWINDGLYSEMLEIEKREFNI
jgi:predicted nucleic acid-binding protein